MPELPPQPESMPLQATLLGPPHFEWNGHALLVPQLRQLALMSFLAMHPKGVERSELAELFWGAGKLHNLRQALHTLRFLAGAGHWLDAPERDARHAVRLRADSDVARVERAVATGDWNEALRGMETPDGQPGILLAHLDLPGSAAYTDWLEAERARLHDLYLEVLQAQIRAQEHGGNSREALAAAQRLAQHLPYHPAVQQQLIRLEAEHGSLEAALLAFERHRATLRSDLGEEPHADTLALVRSLEGPTAGRGLQARWLDAPSEPGLLFGRSEELTQLQAALDGDARVLLQGFGGIGKTALAAGVAHRVLAGGQRVLWLEPGEDEAGTVLDGLAELLDVQAGDWGPPRTRVQALRRALEAAAPALVVLDNAANAYTLARTLEAVPPSIPVLVTARLRHSGLTRQLLERLERTAALKLLQHHAPHLSAPDPRADALCALLGDHPYAVRLAGLTLHRQSARPGDLLARLHDSPHTLGGEEGVAPLLSYSLGTVSDEAYEAFLGLGGLYSPRASAELLGFALRRGTEQTEEALYELTQVGLAIREATPGQDLALFRLHDLAWSYARERQLLRPASAVRAARAYAQAHTAEVALLEPELPNLLGAAGYARQNGPAPELVALLLGLVGGNFLAARGNPPGLLEVLQAAAERADDLNDWPAAQALFGKIGDVYQAFLGDHGAAAAAYQRALGLAASAGLTEREVIYANLLAWSLTLTEAPAARVDALLEEATLLAEAQGDPLLICRTLETGGFVYARRGQPERARERLETAYALLNSLLAEGGGGRDRVQAKLQEVTSNLGQAERRLGHLELALKYKREALTIAEERGEGWRVTTACADVGELLSELERRDEALLHLRRAEEQSLKLGIHSELTRVRDLIARTTIPGERLTAT